MYGRPARVRGPPGGCTANPGSYNSAAQNIALTSREKNIRSSSDVLFLRGCRWISIRVYCTDSSKALRATTSELLLLGTRVVVVFWVVGIRTAENPG